MTQRPGPSTRTLVLALDGATFDVIRPLCAEGRLPNLCSWIEGGSAGPLASTVPPVTFPAWSSFMTGLEPGSHGIFDFTQKIPGAYALRFVNAADRAGESLFATVSRAGGSVLVLGMPATFPPEPVEGLLVCGFDAPVSSGTDARSASDPARYEAIAARVGPWMRPSINESARDAGFHERAIETLLARVEAKQRFTLEALAQAGAEGRPPDLACVVFSESDTVGHHYWRDHDPASPRHDPSAGARRHGAVAAVYEALDRACGEIRAAFGEDAPCVVVSDHGMGGASDTVVHLNRHLEDCGLLARRPRAARDRIARGLRDTALRALPPRVAQGVFRRARSAAARIESTARFGGLDWKRTAAFSEEANTQPGVWINLRGREQSGCVAGDDYEKIRDRVIDALLEWKLSNGSPVVLRARRREDVYGGPYVDRAPDVVVELGLDRGYGVSLVPTPWSGADSTGGDLAAGSVRRLERSEHGGGRGRGMNGTHRREGVFIASTPDAQDIPRHLSHVAPWLLSRLGIEGPALPAPRAPHLYTAGEDELVAARLRALGYLD